MTNDLIARIFSSIERRPRKNLEDFCFFFVLDEAKHKSGYLTHILNKYNYEYLLKPSPYESLFPDMLPLPTMNTELSRLLGHELDDVIRGVQLELSDKVKA
jgi:hypothetical protein